MCPIADWAPIIRPAGEIAFGVVQPGGGVINAQAAWHAVWGYYERVITAKQASPDGGLVAQMQVAMQRAGYTLEEIVRAVATVSNGATALLPVLERALIWLLQRPDTVAEVFLGERDLGARGARSDRGRRPCSPSPRRWLPARARG